MKQSTNNYSASLLTPPVGGRGAKKYTAPQVELISLDNEISLALESSPPIGPGETYNETPDFMRANPFKTFNS
jgi:hypothetical protein